MLRSLNISIRSLTDSNLFTSSIHYWLDQLFRLLNQTFEALFRYIAVPAFEYGLLEQQIVEGESPSPLNNRFLCSHYNERSWYVDAVNR